MFSKKEKKKKKKKNTDLRNLFYGIKTKNSFLMFLSQNTIGKQCSEDQKQRTCLE